MAEPLTLAKTLNVPGTSWRAILMLPPRLAVTTVLFSFLYSLSLPIAMLRAIYLRLVKGKPSQILKLGAHNAIHLDDMHYPCQQVYKEPLDESRLRKALVELAAEDGIGEGKIWLKFHAEKPNDWPTASAFDIDHLIKKSTVEGYSYFDYISDRKKRGEPGAVLRMDVWNGDSGKPTVVFFAGSGYAWDGSANFNFIKELMNRYIGNPPNKVFQRPEITAASAAKFDQGSFLCFLLKMPWNIARNWWNILWNATRAFQWAGGNTVGPKITALNLSKEDSLRLYNGAKALGVKPFAVWTYASVKACKEVLGTMPTGLTQQASLQTRHFPLEGQTTRDLVGDWLFGPTQDVPAEYTLGEAQKGYEELLRELDEVGPLLRDAIWAKAYGIVNSGAAVFQMLPTYSARAHSFDRNIFVNNYGIRTMPPGSPFHWHNWNAPFWFGINTINVDGCTTTFVGSSFWGLDVVKALRDNMEATINEIMAKAPERLDDIPAYRMSARRESDAAEDEVVATKSRAILGWSSA